MSYGTYLRRAAAVSGYSADQVAAAYNCPIGSADGTGTTIGVIELGGALDLADLTAMNLSTANITVVDVGGATPVSDGPNGADGEVALDVEIITQVAPGAKVRVYFTDNTDAGFLQGIQQAVADGVDFISISWGGPESQWPAATISEFDAAFAAAKAKGILTFVASGDSGPDDGTRRRSVDFPASDPNVVGCGGTRLELNSDGSRASETVWDDNPNNDASGGGVSAVFAGRTVPDVSGNGDPVTGYAVVVDGDATVIGGTSAVAPLYAGMSAVIKQVLGKSFDLVATVTANPSIAFDPTTGADGVGGGLGVVDFGKLLAVLQGGTTTTPPPPVNPPPVTTPPSTDAIALLQKLQADCTLLADQANSVGATISAFLASQPTAGA